MKAKLNYLVIPMLTMLTAVLGWIFAEQGRDWYETELVRPALLPPDWFFLITWNIIFVLTTLSALIIWNKGKTEKTYLWVFRREKFAVNFWWIIALFIMTAVLNTLWILLFFKWHLIVMAFTEMILLEIILLFSMLLSWQISKTAALLLLPYIGGVAFSTYLGYLIMQLN